MTADGRPCVVGRFHGQFFSGQLSPLQSASGGSSAVIAMVDHVGPQMSCDFAWAVGTTGIGEATGVALDAAGNCHVAGWIEGSTTLGGTPLGVPGERHAFVAKLDPKGTVLWATSLRADLPDTRPDVAVDPQGNVYLAGVLQGSTTFGSLPVATPSPSTSAVFVAKLDADGNVLSVSLAPEKAPWKGSPSTPLAVAVDSAGNAYVTGRLTGETAFGTTSLARKGAARDLFLAKVDSRRELCLGRFGMDGRWPATGASGGGRFAGNGFVLGEAYGWLTLNLGAASAAVDEDPLRGAVHFKHRHDSTG